jgi:hypothetical protein
MEMGSTDKILEIQTEGEIYTCPVCHYTDGFHVSFKMKNDSKAEVVLICPRCHRRFKIGFNVILE